MDRDATTGAGSSSLGTFAATSGDGLQTHQTVLRCPACAGQCAFVPQTGLLTCESCGNGRDLSHPGDAAAAEEAPFDPESPVTEARVNDGIHIHACTSCGGELVFTGRALSDHCPYCNGAVVRGPEDPAYRTMALIPFAVTGVIAQAHAQAWAAGRIAAPGNLAGIVSAAEVSGLYAPFWTFDSNEAVHYWATQTTGSGKNRRRRTIRGSMETWFDDLLVPASPHVTGLIRDGILHDFRPGLLRAFSPGYLSGFAAERHHQTVGEGLQANAADKDLLIRNRIRRRIGRSRISNIGYRTDTTGIHYRRILLPVWILHYRHRDRPYRIVVSGIDGRTFGERPFSTWKLAAMAALGTAMAMAAGLWWGVMSVS